MNEYTVEQFQKFIRRINCMSDIDFASLYRYSVPGHYFSAAYIAAKYTQSKDNFIQWICELDEQTLDRMIEYTVN